jgi:hypothetical protein
LKTTKRPVAALRQVILLVIASSAIWALLAFISYAEIDFTKMEAERKPLPIDAAISLVTPVSGWTKESYLDPELPHLGVSFGSSVREIDAYQPLAGHQVDTALVFKTWGNNESFERLDFVNLNKRGIMPILSWEPWDNLGSPQNQSEFTLESIVMGEHDAYIENWAREISELEFPIVLRFAHEMNGAWYPWSEQRNGNKKGDFVKAWKHIYEIFETEGARNVIWAWAPNVNRYLRNISLSELYPGDQFVDVIGFSGYSVSDIDDFERVYASSFEELRGFTNKNVLITELGVGGNLATRPDRMKSLLAGLGRTQGVIGYIWFHKSKREDWRIDYSPSTLAAYRIGSRMFYEEWASVSKSSITVQSGLERLDFLD